jgi:hypothetical protein
MLKPLLKNRTTALTAGLFTIAFVICGIAWMRFFTAAASNPSPVRYMDFVTENGVQHPFRQECVGPAFIETDAVWRYCQYETRAATAITAVSEAGEAGQWGLVRFDLKAGQGLMQWPMPEPPDAQILALAPAPTGDLTVAWGSPDLTGIYVIQREGAVESLGVPPDVSVIAGLMWIAADDATARGPILELVAQGESDRFVIFAHDVSGGAGEWRVAREFTLPPCRAEMLCDFQIARYGERGWQFISAEVPVMVDDPAETQIDFVQRDVAGRSQVVGAIKLAELDPDQYTLDESGDLIRLSPLFDQSPANLINWSMDAAPLVFANDFVRRLEVPHPDASFYFSNYEIEGDHLRWIPGLRYPDFGWHMGEWMTLQAGEEGVVLAHYGGESGGETGEPLTTDTTLIKQESQTCVLPASEGGYWILGPYGAYVKADPSMDRADSLNVFERIGRAFDNFGSLGPVQNDSFYREQRALKMAAFPLMLLSLPAGYLLVVFVRQTRPNTRAWLTVLLQVSLVYVVLATIFFWWFWEMTGNF